MHEILENITFIISIISSCIIAYGSLIAIVQFLLNELSRFNKKYSVGQLSIIRLNFGYYLLTGLEFLIAADIIHTILDPTLQDLGVLGGTVIIRIVLTYFLNREVEQGTGI